MNAYSPVFDAWLMVGLVVSAAVLAFDLVVSAWFGRKGRELMRRGRMWGGE